MTQDDNSSITGLGQAAPALCVALTDHPVRPKTALI